MHQVLKYPKSKFFYIQLNVKGEIPAVDIICGSFYDKIFLKSHETKKTKEINENIHSLLEARQGVSDIRSELVTNIWRHFVKFNKYFHMLKY